MDASRCFRGGGLGSGKPLRRFSGLWKLLPPQGHYYPSGNLNRHPDRLRLSGHDSYLGITICFVRRTVAYFSTSISALRGNKPCSIFSASR
jgi:hypothetical protein